MIMVFFVNTNKRYKKYKFCFILHIIDFILSIVHFMISFTPPITLIAILFEIVNLVLLIVVWKKTDDFFLMYVFILCSITYNDRQINFIFDWLENKWYDIDSIQNRYKGYNFNNYI